MLAPVEPLVNTDGLLKHTVVDVKPAAGLGFTETVCVIVDTQPAWLVMVCVTEYVPAAVYVLVGLAVAAVFPSPKLQL